MSNTKMESSKKCSSTLFPATKFWSSSRRSRTPSLSSASSSSSLSSFLSSRNHDHHDDSSPYPDAKDFPATPLRLSGVPFSWEHFPGIPKNQTPNSSNINNKKEIKRLPVPLPRHHGPTVSTHKSTSKKFVLDPFFAAFVECSKDDDEDEFCVDHEEESSSNGSFASGNNGAKISRSSSERFGFVNFYTACKRTCAISQSLIPLPRPTTIPSYDRLSRRRTRQLYDDHRS